MMEIQMLLLTAFSLCFVAADHARRDSQNPMYKYERLVDSLLVKTPYDKDVKPGLPADENITVAIQLSIICAEFSHMGTSVEGWLMMRWQDPRLRWDPADFEDIQDLRLSANRIWKPDIRSYNAIRSEMADVPLIVFHTGDVMWVPPVIYHVRCPQSEQEEGWTCHLKFGSWTHSSDVVDVQETSPGASLNLATYDPACMFTVTDHSSTRNVQYFECCTEPFADILYTFQLGWKQYDYPIGPLDKSAE